MSLRDDIIDWRETSIRVGALELFRTEPGLVIRLRPPGAVLQGIVDQSALQELKETVIDWIDSNSPELAIYLKLFPFLDSAWERAVVDQLIPLVGSVLAVGEGPSWQVIYVNPNSHTELRLGQSLSTRFTVYTLYAEAHRR